MSGPREISLLVNPGAGHGRGARTRDAGVPCPSSAATGVTVLAGSDPQVTITAPGITAHADGERFGALPITIDRVPRAVEVLA